MEKQFELLQDSKHSRAARFNESVVIVGLTAMAIFLQNEINTVLNGTYFFLMFPLVIGITWFSGFRAALFSIVLTAIGTHVVFFEPKFAFGFHRFHEALVLIIFGSASIGTSWAVALLRRSSASAGIAKRELETTLRSIGDAVIVINREKKIVFLNPVAERLTGWSLKEARAQDMATVFRIVNEHTREPAINPVERVLREGIVMGLANHTVLISKDGTEYAIEDSTAPIHLGPNDQPAGVVLVFRDVTEQHATAAKAKIAERNLTENKRLLDQIFEEAPAHMVIVSYPELVFVRANNAYKTLVGRDDVVGKNVLDVLPRYEADGLAGLVNEVAKSKTRFSGVEVPITIADPAGNARVEYFDFIYHPLLNAAGDTYAILGQGTKVTEKVQARRAIEDSKLAVENERENFRNLFQQTPEMVCILIGPTHIFEFVNEAHIRALGFDATGKTVYEAQPESVEVHGILDDVYRTGKTADLHELPVTVGDRLRYFNLTYAARRDSAGAINGVMILGTEVTGEVMAREQLKLSESALEVKSAQLQTMINQMPMAVVFADSSGKLVFANEQVEKVWRHGFFPSETIEKYDEYIGFHPDGRRYEGKDWPLARTLMTGQAIVNEDTDVLLGDGTRGIIRLSSAPVRNSDGELIGGVVVSEDVTQQIRFEQDLKLAKEEAERANELKSAFLANMSHEIRTPLGAMIGFADLLRDPSLGPGERENYTEILARNGENLAVIINDILDLSKVEAGQLSLEFANANPREIAEDVVSLLRVKAHEKGLALDFHCEEDVPNHICSDSLRIRQILLNVTSNAIKFTQYGSVKIRCFTCENAERSPSVCFEVTDTGIGIPESHKEKVFEMFVQADGSMTRRFGGTSRRATTRREDKWGTIYTR